MGPEAVVTQALHQLDPQPGHAAVLKPPPLRPLGETMSRYGRDDHVEGVGGVATVAFRVGQEWDQLQHLVERARPAVGDDKGQRVRTLATLVDEVDA